MSLKRGIKYLKAIAFECGIYMRYTSFLQYQLMFVTSASVWFLSHAQDNDVLKYYSLPAMSKWSEYDRLLACQTASLDVSLKLHRRKSAWQIYIWLFWPGSPNLFHTLALQRSFIGKIDLLNIQNYASILLKYVHVIYLNRNIRLHGSGLPLRWIRMWIIISLLKLDAMIKNLHSHM